MVDTQEILSPLDQIRLIETVVTRQIKAAQVSAEHNIANARLEAERNKEEAYELGRLESQALEKEIISRAEEEAKLITAQGHRLCAELSHSGRQRMKTAVQSVIEIVIGLKDKGIMS